MGGNADDTRSVPPWFPATEARTWPLFFRVISILIIVVSTAFGLAGPSPGVEGLDVAPTVRGEDLALYGAVVDRLRAGEPYYTVLGQELQRRGFPLTPVFNWRQPLGMTVISLFDDVEASARAYFFLAVAGALALGLSCFRAHGIGVAALAFLLVLTCVAPFGSAPGVLFLERWATLLFVFSAAAYIGRLHVVGAAILIASLFFRELALPFCLAGVASAAWDGRRSEVLVWIVGGLFWMGAFGVHVLAVSEALGDIESAGPARSWLAFGGFKFVRSALVWIAPALLFPGLAWAVLVASILGALGMPYGVAPSLRIGFVAFWTSLLFVGLPFNHYWGAMVAGPAAVFLAWAPFVIVDLLRGNPALRAVSDPSMAPQDR